MSTSPQPTIAMTAEDVSRLVDEHFPEIHAAGRRMLIESVGPGSARVRLAIDARNLRPGGTVSGPTMFLLADFAIYVALLANLGAAAIPAVTSNLSITFLLRPEPVDPVAEVRLIRVGRRLAYGEVALYSTGKPEMIAHATGSYAIPAAASNKV